MCACETPPASGRKKTEWAGSSIAPATLRAYRETDYRVEGDAPFTLRIGAASPELAALHRAYHTSHSAFVTACNPYSRVLDTAANAARQASLARELHQRRLAFLPGIGRHPTNAWPGEPSFLVLGLPLEDARILGERFEQNAVVWNGADAVPGLVLLR